MPSDGRPELDPKEIARAAFPTAFRGYDQDAVRRYLRRLAATVAQAQTIGKLGDLSAFGDLPSDTEADAQLRSADLEALEEEAEALRARVAELEQAESDGTAASPSVADLDDAELIILVGQETARVLETARSAAADIVHKAERAASELTDQAAKDAQAAQDEADVALTAARSQADDIRSEAEADAKKGLSTARSDAKRTRDQARSNAEQRLAENQRTIEAELGAARHRVTEIVTGAESLRTEVLTDLIRRRQASQRELDRLVAARDELTAALVAARDELADLESAIKRAPTQADEIDLTEAAADTGPPNDDELDALLAKLEAASLPQTSASPAKYNTTTSPFADPADADDAPEADDSDAEPSNTGPSDSSSGDSDPSDGDPSDGGDEGPVVMVDAVDAVEAIDDDNISLASAAGERRGRGAPSVGAPVGAAVNGSGAGVFDRVIATTSSRSGTDRRESGLQRPAARRGAPEGAPSDLQALGWSDLALLGGGRPPLRRDALRGDLPRNTPYGGRLPASFTARDEALSEATAGFRRWLRRAVNDDQSDVLDRLRAGRGPIDSAELQPVMEQLDAYTEALRPVLIEMARAGGELLSRPSIPSHAIENLCQQLAKHVVESLRLPTIKVIEEATSDDRELILDPIRAIYRDFRNQALPDLIDDALHEAYALGAYHAISPDDRVIWVPDPRLDADPICEENSAARPLLKGSGFPSGHARPLSMPGCRCLVLPMN